MQLKMTVFTTCAKSYKEGLEYLVYVALASETKNPFFDHLYELGEWENNRNPTDRGMWLLSRADKLIQVF